MQAEFLRLIPGSQGATIPNCGHLPHVECTAAFAEHFNRFVAGARA
jgi:pimeloyl-ACP methyl ester carboxylesterase